MNDSLNFEDKYDFALNELGRSKIWPSNYNPPLVRLIRHLGFKVPPPHYNSFFGNAILMGTMFGILWGVLMYLMLWQSQNMTTASMLTAVGIAGSLFGLSMASYYKYSAKKNALTPWHAIV